MKMIFAASHRKVKFLLKTLPLILGLSVFGWMFLVKDASSSIRSLLSSHPRPSESEAFRAFYLSGNSSTSLPLEAIRSMIRKRNEEQVVQNSLSFPPSLSPNDPVVVIQVHNRGNYLQGLINSLSIADGIEKALLIFSHDVYDDNINSIIAGIKFCRVMQIFYPFSLQVYPNSFPGTDPKDCPRDLPVDEAKKRRCLNANFPDAYGHYREATYTQTKHHWFWKGNFVINHLKMTSTHNGPFLFLEEDHYVAPDIFHFLMLMRTFREVHCPECNIMTLGSYAKTHNFARMGNKVEVAKWFSSRHNMGLVFDRLSWAEFVKCSESFCTYDDYNWDWSLQHVSAKCLDRQLKTVAVAVARVFHVGVCGVHHKGKDCFDLAVTRKVQGVLNASKPFLFPPSIQETRSLKRNTKMPKVNGGWSDKRDHILCLSHLENSMKTPVETSRQEKPIITQDNDLHVRKHLIDVYENEIPTQTLSSHQSET